MAEGVSSDFRFGWLEAFIAVGSHLSYEAAAAEVGVDATSLSRNVKQLENWLGRTLVEDDKPIQLSQPFGPSFLDLAKLVMGALEDVRTREESLGGRPLYSENKSDWRSVGIYHFESLLAVNANSTRDGAAHHLGVTYHALSRYLRDLKKVMDGRDLIVRDGQEIRLTSLGHELAQVGKMVRDAMEGARLFTPEGVELFNSQIRFIADIMQVQIEILQKSVAQLATGKRMSKKRRAEIDGRKKSIDILERARASLPSKYLSKEL